MLLLISGVAVAIAGSLTQQEETAAADLSSESASTEQSPAAAPDSPPAPPAGATDSPQAATGSGSGGDAPLQPPSEDSERGPAAGASDAEDGSATGSTDGAATTGSPAAAPDDGGETDSAEAAGGGTGGADTAGATPGSGATSETGGAGTGGEGTGSPVPAPDGGGETDSAEAAAGDGTGAEAGAGSGTGAEAGAEVAALIAQLRPLVAQPDPSAPAYDRDYFAGWKDNDGDCVNTRHEILQVEAADYSMNAAGCLVAAGEWFDPYTNQAFSDPRDLDVDHVVALADAWVSGAWQWADDLLDRFSNDLGNLNAIAAGENRSKSAKGPAEYSPTAAGARCDYLVQYATVKITWRLTIAPQDFNVVADGLTGCEVGELPEPRSPLPAAAASTASATGAASASDCHPAYEPCLPNLPRDALNCSDLTRDQKPITVLEPGVDPYRFDRDGDGRGCTS